MTVPKLFRHPGLVPGSNVPRVNGAWVKPTGGCRNEPGMTEGKRA